MRWKEKDEPWRTCGVHGGRKEVVEKKGWKVSREKPRRREEKRSERERRKNRADVKREGREFRYKRSTGEGNVRGKNDEARKRKEEGEHVKGTREQRWRVRGRVKVCEKG